MLYGKRRQHYSKPIFFSMKLRKTTILLIRMAFFIVVETFPYEIVQKCYLPISDLHTLLPDKPHMPTLRMMIFKNLCYN